MRRNKAALVEKAEDHQSNPDSDKDSGCFESPSELLAVALEVALAEERVSSELPSATPFELAMCIVSPVQAKQPDENSAMPEQRPTDDHRPTDLRPVRPKLRLSTAPFWSLPRLPLLEPLLLPLLPLLPMLPLLAVLPSHR